MKVNVFTHSERLPYLQEELKEKLVVLSEVDTNGQVKISIDVIDGLDVLYIFHAGIKCGSDSMAKALTSR
jgi:hypothetical protein